MVTSAGSGQLAPVRFARRSSRGFAFGMSKSQLAAVGAAFVVFAAAIVMSRVGGVVVFSPVWGMALLVAYVPVHGRKIIDWLPLVLHWWWRKAAGQTRFRARPLRPRPVGTLALPGDAARLRALVDEATGAALVHDPHLGHSHRGVAGAARRFRAC